MMKNTKEYLISVLLIWCQSSQCKTKESDDCLLTQNEVAVRQRAKELRQFVLPMPEDMFSDLLVQTANKYIPVHALYEECRNHSNYVLDSFLRGDIWAVKMLDAGSKLVSGVLDGHIQDLGNYDQCIKIQEPNQLFTGQMCVVETAGVLPQEIADKINFKRIDRINMDVVFSVCVPSSCTDEDVTSHIDLVLAPVNASTFSIKGLGKSSDFSRVICTSGEGVVYRTKDLIAIFVFTAIAVLVVTGSICGPESVLLSYFSLSRNFQSLMDTRTSPAEVSCLNGLRVVFIVMVVFYHRIHRLLTLPTHRFDTIIEKFGTTTMGILEIFPKSVDVFFLVGGTVMSYSFFRSRQKDFPFTTLHFYIYRYFRLTPLLAVVMLYYATLFIHTSEGPLWVRQVATKEDMCIRHWWAGLLHISNYAVPNYICIVQSWYVACDFQLYIISPVFLLTLLKRPPLGMTLLTVCFAASIAATTINAYFKKLSSGYLTATVFGDRVTDFADNTDYTGFHLRAPPFLMGIALGYRLFIIRRDKIHPKMTKKLLWLGWTFSLGLIISLVAVTTTIVDPDHEFNPWLDPLYIGLSKPLFCVSFVWVIFVCTTGYGGFVNQFLSWPLFRPLARLTYGVFMVHILIQFIQTGRTQVPVAFSYVDQVYLVTGDITFSFCLASVLYVTVEMPICGVVTHILKDEKKIKQFNLDSILVSS